MTPRPLVAVRYRSRNAVGYARRHPARVLARLLVLAALVATAVFFVAPLYWLFSAAFKPPGTLSVPPQVVPSRVGPGNFLAVLRETAFLGTYFPNSLLVSAATVLLTVGIATPAGYGLSRYTLRYQTHLMVSLLVVQMIPIVALVIPLYRLFSLAGLLDTLVVVVLADTALVVPIAIWLIKGYFDTIPDRLEEAARVGGASRFRAFRVVLPLARPAIGAAALYAFVVSWNQFVIPLTFTSSAAVRTFPVGLYGFISRHGVVNWGLLGAACVVAMLPVVALFVVFQEQFVEGLVGSGLKGG